MMNRGYREFIIDLRNCVMMDSTFMGTLAGVALRLKELGHGHLHVVHCGARSHELLIRTPMGRFGQVDEVAGAAVFLASDAASFITGQTLVIDGGFLASGVNQ